jgi:hypothetical protein
MVKVGDKVRSLVNWLDTEYGKEYTVMELQDEGTGETTGVWLLETNDYLSNDEFELVDDTPTIEWLHEEELQNTERYKTGSGKQLFDVFEDDLLTYMEARGFYKANIIKYTHRYKHKGGIEDLKKVKVYVDQLIKLEEKQNEV